jgi:hypothetical protein
LIKIHIINQCIIRFQRLPSTIRGKKTEEATTTKAKSTEAPTTRKSTTRKTTRSLVRKHPTIKLQPKPKPTLKFQTRAERAKSPRHLYFPILTKQSTSKDLWQLQLNQNQQRRQLKDNKKEQKELDLIIKKEMDQSRVLPTKSSTLQQTLMSEAKSSHLEQISVRMSLKKLLF